MHLRKATLRVQDSPFTDGQVQVRELREPGEPRELRDLGHSSFLSLQRLPFLPPPSLLDEQSLPPWSLHG